MDRLLPKEVSFQNIETYDERELMFMAFQKRSRANARSMPEVDLVQRILKLPQSLEPKAH